MRPWWPKRARAAWALLAPTRKRRARSLLHTLHQRFAGVALDQHELLVAVEERDRVGRDPALVTLRRLERLGLISRREVGDRTVVWLPEHLRHPPER